MRTRGADALLLVGNKDRATLYAVYALLERLGVRFFTPDFPFYKHYAEQVPTQASIRVADLDLKVTPSFPYRRKDVGEGGVCRAEARSHREHGGYSEHGG